jgi:aldehyde dehydrogenase (NAD+)
MTTVSETDLTTYRKLFIGGRWVPPSSDAQIEVISPITGQVIAMVPAAREADVDAAVAAARKAFDEGPWPRMAPAERAVALLRVRDEIVKRLPAMATAFTEEVGVPVVMATLFQEQAVAIWEDAATFHSRFDFEHEERWVNGHGKVLREPVGVVATIIPWNVPVAAASLKMAPALAAGCTVVLKPADDGPTSCMLLAEALEAADLPEGVVSVLPAGREVGEHLVRHRGVDKISFTGSTAAGRRIMSLAAERIARVTLELGGKSAAIIADEVDLDNVVPQVVFAGVSHSGQICAALTRVLVPRGMQDDVVGRMKAMMEMLPVGDPREETTFIGPLVAERQQERVLNYIEIGKQEGARLVTGGGKPANLDTGWYVQPTLFADVTNDMRIAQEEIFGPVVVVIPFDSIDEAVSIANDSAYGLSGAVFAADAGLAESIARRVRTGQIAVNHFGASTTQPFGGYKQSGIGREGGLEGFSEYFETKLLQLP